MKLVFCSECHDLWKLHEFKTVCICGSSSGMYIDNLNAVISGKAIPVGVDNHSFVRALDRRNLYSPVGYVFEAFTIPDECDTIEHVERIEEEEWVKVIKGENE